MVVCILVAVTLLVAASGAPGARRSRQPKHIKASHTLLKKEELLARAARSAPSPRSARSVSSSSTTPAPTVSVTALSDAYNEGLVEWSGNGSSVSE